MLCVSNNQICLQTFKDAVIDVERWDSVNDILETYMDGTTPNLSHPENVSSCIYEPIVSENRFIQNDLKRNLIVNMHGIRLGGEYIPSNCKTKFSTAIIVPYRNRSDQLNIFINYMHNFLRLQQIHYRIYLIEQTDQNGFNRAKLFNIGSIYAIRVGFPCLIFHDVDLLPLNLGNLYVCSHKPHHMATNIDKFHSKMPYKNYIGGVISMKPEIFQLVNGMSNIVSLIHAFIHSFIPSFIQSLRNES